MKHLSRDELIDSLDGTLPPAREAHVDSCATCRAERASLQQVLHRVAAVEVPEPSPLFWEHFGARIREAVALQPQPAASRWTPSAWSWDAWPRWAVGMATLVVCVSLGWAGWRDYHGRNVDKSGSVRLLHDAAPDTSDLVQAAAPDEDWNLVVSMAEDVTVDDADEPGLAVRPGASDRAMTDLSSEQRSELARLLTAEMTRPAS
jgi:hypothetical protein